MLSHEGEQFFYPPEEFKAEWPEGGGELPGHASTDRIESAWGARDRYWGRWYVFPERDDCERFARFLRAQTHLKEVTMKLDVRSALLGGLVASVLLLVACPQPQTQNGDPIKVELSGTLEVQLDNGNPFEIRVGNELGLRYESLPFRVSQY